jgi:hypothetical protein
MTRRDDPAALAPLAALRRDLDLAALAAAAARAAAARDEVAALDRTLAVQRQAAAGDISLSAAADRFEVWMHAERAGLMRLISGHQGDADRLRAVAASSTGRCEALEGLVREHAKRRGPHGDPDGS